MNKFKKIFLTFVILFSFFSAKSYAEVVNKVKLTGNERITLETVVIFGDIKVGEDYKVSDINLIIKKLYQSNFFSNISVELQGGVLSITVKENPIINIISFDGEKANKNKEAIFEVLTLREKSSFIQNNVKTDVNILKTFYRQLGYYFVEIDAEIERLPKNRVNLVYKINKGEKAKISKIFFLGDKKIRDTRLRDIITSEENKFWKFISRNVYLSENRINLDKRLLKNYYKNRGYYEVEVVSSNVEYSDGEGFILTFSINAGKRYKFKKITANVSDELDKSAFVSLEEEFSKLAGEYYSSKKLTLLLEKLDKLSEQKELQFVNHKLSETLDGDSVDVAINIFEGEKFTIERIDISGNSVTNDSVIRGELLVDEGDPYSALLIAKSMNKIRSRGLFAKVEEKIEEGSNEKLKVLKVSVEEKPTGEISAGFGIGTDGTAFLFSVKENNWLGRGIKLTSTLDLTETTIAGSLSLNNPNFNYSGNSVFGSVNLSATDESVSSSYKSSKSGFSLGTEFEQYENVYFSPSIRANLENIEVERTASTSIQNMEGEYTNIDFAYGITYDQRNQSFKPTDGFVTQFSQSIPLIQDGSSFSNTLIYKSYQGWSENVIGSLKLTGKAIAGIDDDVRLTNRLKLNEKQLRGFNVKKVGPKDGENYIGGNYITSFTYETQLPNLLPESTKTDIVAFIDGANIWGVDYNSKLNDNRGKLRAAIGISANVYTTIGPLSFTFAQDLSKGNDDVTESFSFRLGTSF